MAQGHVNRVIMRLHIILYQINEVLLFRSLFYRNPELDIQVSTAKPRFPYVDRVVTDTILTNFLVFINKRLFYRHLRQHIIKPIKTNVIIHIAFQPGLVAFATHDRVIHVHPEILLRPVKINRHPFRHNQPITIVPTNGKLGTASIINFFEVSITKP